MRRTNVGTWRTTSERCDCKLRTVFFQTWHATSLHMSGNGTVGARTWHATTLVR
ncbi:MAG: hypothetical protein HDS84_01740 [Bacteroidales bacterium]|nr:hypothetical protein [Bacteroidales bacterium]